MRPIEHTAINGTRLYLVRHGQTEFNALDIIRGCMDIPLNETGHGQAKRLARMLEGKSISRVVSGPLTRARQTAAHIAGASELDYEVDEDLLDRDYGPWTGWSRAQVNSAFGHADNAPDIEPYESFSSRVNAALSRIVGEARPGETVVVVGHKAINRALLSDLFPYSLSEPRRITQRTGCWNLCEFDGTHWTLGVIDALPSDEAYTARQLVWEARHPVPRRSLGSASTRVAETMPPAGFEETRPAGMPHLHE